MIGGVDEKCTIGTRVPLGFRWLMWNGWLSKREKKEPITFFCVTLDFPN